MNLTLDDVKDSFVGQRATLGGRERHSILSLSKRTLLSRQAVRKGLSNGLLKFEARFDAPQGATFEFSSQYLDEVRGEVVTEVINEIRARLAGLNLSEQEEVAAAFQGLGQHEKDIKAQEFSAKDEDPEVNYEVRRILGAGLGAFAGAAAHGEIQVRGGYIKAGQDIARTTTRVRASIAGALRRAAGKAKI